MKHTGVFVTGTDTGVGKTQVAAGIAAVLRRRLAGVGIGGCGVEPLEFGVEPPPSATSPRDGGDCATLGSTLPGGTTQRREPVGLWKPVQTGTALGSADADSLRLKRGSGTAQEEAEIASYTFPEPLAPWISATRAGTAIDMDLLAREGRRRKSEHRFLVVEGAGGLAVPLTERDTVAGLAQQLELPLLIVARPGLGTVNHTLLTISMAKSLGLNLVGVILNGCDDVYDRMVSDNAMMIERFGDVQVIGKLPHFACSASSAEEWADWNARWLQIMEENVDWEFF